MSGKKEQHSNEYKEGYGQAKADLLIQISKAFKLIHGELTPDYFVPEEYTPNKEQRKEITIKQETLKWVRSMIKGLKPSR